MLNGISKVDKVRVFLNAEGRSYIVVGDLSDLATKADMQRDQFYQALYRLQHFGEVEIESDVKPGSNRKVVVGIKVKKLATLPSIAEGTITNKDKAERKRTVSAPIIPAPALPAVSSYIHQKTVLDEIAAELSTEGFAPETVQINFTPNPIGEEAIGLLDLLERANTAIANLAAENKKLESDNKIYEEMINGTKPQGVDALASPSE